MLKPRTDSMPSIDRFFVFCIFRHKRQRRWSERQWRIIDIHTNADGRLNNGLPFFVGRVRLKWKPDTKFDLFPYPFAGFDKGIRKTQSSSCIFWLRMRLQSSFTFVGLFIFTEINFSISRFGLESFAIRHWDAEVFSVLNTAPLTNHDSVYSNVRWSIVGAQCSYGNRIQCEEQQSTCSWYWFCSKITLEWISPGLLDTPTWFPFIHILSIFRGLLLLPMPPSARNATFDNKKGKSAPLLIYSAYAVELLSGFFRVPIQCESVMDICLLGFFLVPEVSDSLFTCFFHIYFQREDLRWHELYIISLVAPCTLPKGRKSLNWSAQTPITEQWAHLCCLPFSKKRSESGFYRHINLVCLFFVASSTKRSGTQLHEMHVHEHEHSMLGVVAVSEWITPIPLNYPPWHHAIIELALFCWIRSTNNRKKTRTEHFPARKASQARFFLF